MADRRFRRDVQRAWSVFSLDLSQAMNVIIARWMCCRSLKFLMMMPPRSQVMCVSITVMTAERIMFTARSDRSKRMMAIAKSKLKHSARKLFRMIVHSMCNIDWAVLPRTQQRDHSSSCMSVRMAESALARGELSFLFDPVCWSFSICCRLRHPF